MYIALCRSYYRCSQKASRGCPAQKHVQKTENHIIPAGYDITYINEHTCGGQSIGMSDNNHAADYYNYYINRSSDDYLFSMLNSRSALEDNNQINASILPCDIVSSTSSENFLSSQVYVHDQSNYLQSLGNMASSSSASFYHHNSSMINSPISIDYAEHTQASCSNFDVIFDWGST